MSDTEMRQWVEPDPEVLDHLTRLGMFGCDRAQIEAFNQTSSIPGPDGRPQPLTDAEMAHVGVRAALRVLLANGLIEARWPPDDDVMLQLDPPDRTSPRSPA